MNMKFSQEYRTALYDFQHQVESKIKNNEHDATFPQRPSQLSEEELADYLFEYQAALDSAGSERSQYTIAGFLVFLPIIVLSAFPDQTLPFKGFYNVLMAIGIGLVLFLVYKILSKLNVQRKIKVVNTKYPYAKNYVDKVIGYQTVKG